MIVGLLVTSIISGQLISRTGRYRVFPILGTLLMSVGLLLLTRLDVGTSTAASAVYLFVLGLGLGSIMQVLVLAVQNAVDYRLLGAATSGVTMLRGIGGSIGTAVFGTIFTTRLSRPAARRPARPARRAGEPTARASRAPRSRACRRGRERSTSTPTSTR